MLLGAPLPSVRGRTLHLGPAGNGAHGPRPPHGRHRGSSRGTRPRGCGVRGTGRSPEQLRRTPATAALRRARRCPLLEGAPPQPLTAGILSGTRRLPRSCRCGSPSAPAPHGLSAPHATRAGRAIVGAHRQARLPGFCPRSRCPRPAPQGPLAPLPPGSGEAPRVQQSPGPALHNAAPAGAARAPRPAWGSGSAVTLRAACR